MKKVEREKGKNNLDDDEKMEKKESTSVRKQIREKLQKFLAKIPVFMYVTDFREEALKDVIESLDSDLFTRVTGLTVDDFRLLNKIGVFNAQHMNAAIYQFKSFETASLHYADETVPDETGHHVGLWYTTNDAPSWVASSCRWASRREGNGIMNDELPVTTLLPATAVDSRDRALHLTGLVLVRALPRAVSTGTVDAGRVPGGAGRPRRDRAWPGALD